MLLQEASFSYLYGIQSTSFPTRVYLIFLGFFSPDNTSQPILISYFMLFT